MGKPKGKGRKLGAVRNDVKLLGGSGPCGETQREAADTYGAARTFWGFSPRGCGHMWGWAGQDLAGKPKGKRPIPMGPRGLFGGFPQGVVVTCGAGQVTKGSGQYLWGRVDFLGFCPKGLWPHVGRVRNDFKLPNGAG